MWEDCLAPSRVLFEVSGHGFKGKPSQWDRVLFLSVISCPGRDAEWMRL